VSAKRDQLLREYEEGAVLHLAAITVGGYLKQMRAVLRWLDEKGIDLASVRLSDLLAHLSELATARKKDGNPYSAGQQQKRVSALKSFFRFLVRRGYVLQDPAAPLEMPKSESRLPRTILTKDEAQRIIEVARGKSPRELRDRAILETLYGSGIRACELIALTPQDVDTQERTLHVVLGKGRKGRMVPLTHAAARAIEAYLAFGRAKLLRYPATPWLFVSDWGMRAYNFTLNTIVQRYAKKARVRKRVTCHTFRHSIATHLLKGHADIRHIQVFLGHRSLQSTQRYTRVEISDLREVVRRAHPRGR
jgi:integrase/recombinase XerD